MKMIVADGTRLIGKRVVGRMSSCTPKFSVYLDQNIGCSVPLLESDGLSPTESFAIVTYLGDVYPGKKLLGDSDWLVGTRSIVHSYLLICLRWAAHLDIGLHGLFHLMKFAHCMNKDAGARKALFAHERVLAQGQP
ncbi:hypothetical protein [Dyella sp.]|uniref:hypothetical protein n=1 Tax=Dyella sp. TaxID=1869338 RepID=UPI002B45F5C2|nr:hypothetical protein [Dyella sp.]HKT26861.1 hypothetical protein [Dyella sp.]